MKLKSLNKSNLKWALLLLLVGFIRIPLHSQDNQINLPYPIIFIHGITGSDHTWDVMNQFLTEKYGLIYGGRMDFCLNNDAKSDYSELPYDYFDYTNTNPNHKINLGDFYTINFAVDLFGNPKYINGDENPAYVDIESNQSAIVKQGLAVKDAIKHVLDITKRDKVILVCHSMGGLAAREYIQNSNLWQEPGIDHHVAKLCTLGTPHGGSNSTDLGTGISGIDLFSEGVRDLRTSYLSGKKGVYLFGGFENFDYMRAFVNSDQRFYNVDVNCNGLVEEKITGLNDKYFPPNLAIACMVGTGDLLGGDGIVSAYSANINNILPVRAEIFSLTKKYPELYIPLWHTQLPDQIGTIIKIIDEPKDPSLAYEILEKGIYQGAITFGPNKDPEDLDVFKVVLKKDGTLTVNVNGPIFSGVKKVYLLDEYENCQPKVVNLYEDLTYDLKSGTYYVAIQGTADEGGPGYSGTGYYPYKISTNFVADQPASMSSFPESLQFYDVVLNSSKNSSFKLTNNGATTILITAISISGSASDQFSVTPMPPYVIWPGTTQESTVSFKPTSAGLKVALIEISTNSPDIPIKSISLNGNGTVHETKVLVNNLAGAYNFGDTKMYYNKTKTFSLQNTGSSTCNISNISFEGLNRDNFSIISPTSIPFDLASGETKLIKISFSPTEIGVKQSSLIITNNSDNLSPNVTIDLYGNGVENAYSGNTNEIIAYEYWFDDQYIAKTEVQVSRNAISLLETIIQTEGLYIGLHSLHLRYKDSNGKWSSITSEFFQKLPLTADGPRKITTCEYWFDDKFDSKISIPVTPNQTISINSAIDLTSLSVGLHSYHVRYKDDIGQWSAIVSEFFNKQPVTATGPHNITTCEYWFDDDFTNKISSKVMPGQTITKTDEIDVSALTSGLHSYHTRYKDNVGQWSSIVSEFFFKSGKLSPNNVVTKYRYWFDTNDAEIITKDVQNSVNPYLLIKNINTCNLSQGNHTIHFQFQDENLQWSSVTNSNITKDVVVIPVITASGSATVCEGTSLQLSSSIADTYLWSNGATTQSIEITKSGDYSVTVNPESGCGLTSDVYKVVINPLPDKAGTISGTSTIYPGQNDVSYSIPVIANVSAYQWTLPDGATGTSTTNEITLDFGVSAISGDLKVYGQNDCGIGASSILQINIKTILSPPVVESITQPDCKLATGIVLLNGLPETGTWILTGTPGSITDTGTGTSTTILNIEPGTYSFTVTDALGNISETSTEVVINPQPVTPSAPSVGTVTQPSCTLATGSVELNDLPATGTWTLTRTPDNIISTGMGVSTTISGLPTGTYVYTVTNASGCTSVASGNIVITTQPIAPFAPTGNASQSFCAETLPKIDNLTATGIGIKWYYSATGGSALPTTTTLITGTHYYASQYNGSCESTTRLDVVVTINASPKTPANITGTTSTCIGSATTLKNKTKGGVWSSLNPNIATVNSMGVVTGLNEGQCTIQYTVNNTSGCSSNATANISVSAPVYQPDNFIESTSSVSLGQTNLVYSVPSVADVTYKWSYSGKGATITGSSNSVLISFSLKATSGTLSVSAVNACGTSSPRSLAISILKSAILPNTSGKEIMEARMANLEILMINNELKVYPNPTLGLTTFEFHIDEAAKIHLDLYSMSGMHIARIFDAETEAGVKQTVMNNLSLSSGTYNCVLSWKEKKITIKLVVRK